MVVLPSDALVRGRGSLASADLETSKALLEALPYPVMHIAPDYDVLWMNTAAVADYRSRRGSCFSISHGRSQPCHYAGELCPKLRAEERQEATSVNHVHVVSGGVEIYKVVALPVREGGVLELHIPLEDVLARDGLTGLYSRDFFWMLASRQLALLERLGAPFAVIVFDLDFFKKVNDEFGHAVGDALLRATGDAVVASVRASDTAGRLGGEEFAVFLPSTGGRPAREVAERLQRNVRAVELREEAPGLRVTASFGVYAAEPGETLERGLERADAALYRAKRGGRDRIESDG